MVDRGGLNYPIRVKDEFSKTTALFRKELRASKKEFRDFQKVVKGQKSATSDIRAQAKATNELAKAQRSLAKATKATVKPMTDEERATMRLAEENKKLARQLALAAKAQRERERTSIALRNAMERDARAEAARIKRLERERVAAQKLADSKNVELVARKKNAQAAFQEAVALKRVEQLKAQAAASFRGGDFRGGAQQLRNAKALEKSLNRQVSSAQKLLFTFRRLVGALAIFTLARKGVQAFQDLVKAGIQFNDVVETATLGIAGLVVTLGDVRDAQGQSVEATEQLNLALGVAREQTAKLRQDSLKTVATFEQLLDTFQVSVGPGLAAGLNLDEVRQLTVDISQAAGALGVPQNQLAEEVRSLLSGTIQARTTRIATALGISNEDVRRLKETGELFDFLEEKFAGFAEAAEKQARTTFTGITTLIKGLVQEILGNAARPLFEELISLGNDLFDNFLSIRDAAGNIRPSPEVVAAFQQVFDAIKRSVEGIRELGNDTALDALETTLGTIAITIDFISGVVTELIAAFGFLSGLVQDVAEFFGLAGESAGATAKTVGKLVVDFILIRKALGVINLRMLKFAGAAGVVVAAFVAIAKAVEFVLEKIFGIDLGIRDTIQLITVGLYSAWIGVASIVQEVAIQSVNFLENALDSIITAAKNKASGAKGFLSSLFGDDEGAQRAAQERLDRELESTRRIQARNEAAALKVADVQAQAAAKQKALEEEISKTIGERAKASAEGPGFRAGFDPKAAAKEAADAANAFVSTANRSVADLAGSLGKVNDELVKSEQLFAQAQRATGAGGVAGQVESEFNKEEIAAAERLRKIKADLLLVDQQIARLREAGVEETEGALVSALQDQELLQTAILNAEEQSLALAGLKAATIAANTLPALREEAKLVAAEVAAERAKTAAITANASDRQLALVAAQTAVQLAEAELAAAERKNQLERETLAAQAAKLPPGEELNALNQVNEALAVRAGFEEEILRLRLEQLEAAQREAELVASGSLTDGLQEGFQQFAEQFGSTFQAGINIARAAVDGLAQFASQAIVDAFDPTKEVDIKERFARLMQSIAQTILQQLIQLAIAKAILGFKDGGVVPELSAGGIPLSFAKGGRVPGHFSKRAQGLAGGGLPRPGHIPSSDTVPAWLTPGEFVMNKAATSQFLPLLEGMNGGSMAVTGSASAEAAGPSTGMASGGLVSDMLAEATAAGGGDSDQGGLVVVPAVVANDKEMDTFSAGGKNALLSFMRENAGNINALLERSPGGRN